MDFPELVVGVLALWFLAASIAYWDGPGDVLLRLRQIVGTEYIDEEGKAITFLGRQLQCFWCCAFWLAFPVTLILLVWWCALVPFALAGATLLLSHSGRTVWRRMIG